MPVKEHVALYSVVKLRDVGSTQLNGTLLERVLRECVSGTLFHDLK
jgi:hypothetical protein